MAEIKKIYEDSARTQDIYPITHEKAVIDNNGTTAETKFQMITDLVQQAQMEVGAVPSDLTPTDGSSHWVTSGGIFSALSFAYTTTDKTNSTSSAGNYWISSLDNYKWKSTNTWDGYFIKITGGAKLTLKASSINVYYAILKNNTITSNVVASFATGETATRRLFTTDGSICIDLPSDAQYLWYGLFSNEWGAPELVEESVADKLLSIDKGEELRNYWLKNGVITNHSSAGAYWISSLDDYKWKSTSTWEGTFVKVVGGTQITIHAPSNGGVYYGILKSNTISANVVADFATGISATARVSAGSSATIDLPDDAQYLWYGLFKTNYAWLSPLEITGYEFVSAQWIDNKFVESTNDNWANTSSWTEAEYEGGRIVFPQEKQKYRMKLWASGTTGTNAQGFAISNNYLFRAYDGGTCKCYPLYEGECGTGTSFDFGSKGSRNHCNTIQFAHSVESGNTFPYLYISKCYNDNNEGAICYVENVTTSSSTLVQTITVSNDFLPKQTNFNIDEEGFIYSITATSGTNNYTFNIYKFRKVLVSEGASVTLTATDLVEEIDVATPYMYNSYVWQGSKIYNHKLYIFFGAVNKKIGFFVFDLDTKALTNVVYVNSVINKEIEDGDFYNGVLYMLANGTANGVKLVTK